MKDVPRTGLAVSAALAAVAGYVDAIGFIETGGLFVSFMSGNSTQAAVELAGFRAEVALAAAGIVVAFVAGVCAGGLLVARARDHKPALVGGVAVAVAAAAALELAGDDATWRVAILAAAMGAVNTLYLADGRARVAITYATGTLVALGLALSELFSGGSRTAWRRPLLLWGCLVGGAIVGAAAYTWGAAPALGAAAVTLGILALSMHAHGRRQRRVSDSEI